MTESKSRRFAMLLQAIEEEESALSSYKADHKARMETLHGELQKLKMDELTGQLSLVPEPPDSPRITEAEELQPAGD